MENLTIENQTLAQPVEKKKRGRKPFLNKEDYKFLTFRVKKESADETRQRIKELLKTLS